MSDAGIFIVVVLAIGVAGAFGAWDALYDFGDRYGYRLGRWLLGKLGVDRRSPCPGCGVPAGAKHDQWCER